MTSFRDRFYTRKTGNLITAPSTVILTGAVGALVIASGAPLILAPLAGLSAGAARVLAGMPKAPKKQRVDLSSLDGQWWAAVNQAQHSQAAFRQLEPPANNAGQERFNRVANQIDEVVAQTFNLAQQGQRLTQAKAVIDTDRLDRQLQRTDLPDQAVEAVEAQLASAARFDSHINSTNAELMVVNARLNELVARAAELTVNDDEETFQPIESGLVDLLDELEATRQAAEEVATD